MPSVRRWKSRFGISRLSFSFYLETKKTSSSAPQCHLTPYYVLLSPTTKMSHLSRFQNITQIGQGSNGTVYKATMKNTEQQVVLKRLSSKMSKRRVEAEIKAGKTLRGVEGVPHFHQDFVESGSTWLVFDLVNGVDLLEWMDQTNFAPVEESKAKEVFKQLVRILSECHSSGVANKDIKLENIMIGKDGKVTMIDFGLSYNFDSIVEDEMCSDRCGSCEYAAPEITFVQNSPFSASKADIWSLGITLFCILFGCFPYSYDQKQCRYIESTGTFPAPAFPSSSKVSSEAKSLILSMLDVNVDTRISIESILSHPWLSKKNKTL
eukprot:TRINITY_DN1635_c0_g1_i1.p1 TRINITY_DN1635_c0_g1~~TRINITY_DN1635_c0_g1_i1.p1  ORF type:complete len:322 (-),score=73.84 TRINITY_DN1635_c0_g1_i1:37-1002(-)